MTPHTNRYRPWRGLSLALTVATALAAPTLATPALAAPIIGIVGPRSLVGFDSATPGTVTSTLEITGIGGDLIRGLDFRPAMGELYAFGQSGGLYVVNPVTGAATSIGPGIPNPGGFFEAGFAFNPTVDRIRVTTADDVNRRVNPITGATLIDGPLAYAAADPNAGQNPTVTAVAYTNQLAGVVAATALFGIDVATSSLVRINPANDGTLLTIGALGVSLFGPTTGFGIALDIDGATGIGYASLLDTVGAYGFYSVNLGTGAATLIGGYGQNSVREITVGQLGPVAVPDLTARLLAQHMAGPMQRQFLVENRPGANGVIASEAVAKAPPDGIMLLVAPREVFGVNPVLYAPLPYDAERAFAPIGIATAGHYVLVANPGLGVVTLADLVALARRRELAYGSTGVGSMPHLNVEAFARDAGIRLLHVPFRGTAPSATATVAGDVALMIATPPSVAALVQDGRLVALGVGSSTRLPQLPTVPTLAEAGIAPNALMPNYFALAAPAGTPAPLVARLNAAMRQALEVPETIERLRAGGLTPAPGSPEELQATIAADIRHFGELIRTANIRRE